MAEGGHDENQAMTSKETMRWILRAGFAWNIMSTVEVPPNLDLSGLRFEDLRDEIDRDPLRVLLIKQGLDFYMENVLLQPADLVSYERIRADIEARKRKPRQGGNTNSHYVPRWRRNDMERIRRQQAEMQAQIEVLNLRDQSILEPPDLANPEVDNVRREQQNATSSADGIQQLLPGEAVGGEQPSAEAAPIAYEDVLMVDLPTVPEGAVGGEVQNGPQVPIAEGDFLMVDLPTGPEGAAAQDAVVPEVAGLTGVTEPTRRTTRPRRVPAQRPSQILDPDYVPPRSVVLPVATAAAQTTTPPAATEVPELPEMDAPTALQTSANNEMAANEVLPELQNEGVNVELPAAPQNSANNELAYEMLPELRNEGVNVGPSGLEFQRQLQELAAELDHLQQLTDPARVQLTAQPVQVPPSNVGRPQENLCIKRLGRENLLKEIGEILRNAIMKDVVPWPPLAANASEDIWRRHLKMTKALVDCTANSVIKINRDEEGGIASYQLRPSDDSFEGM